MRLVAILALLLFAALSSAADLLIERTRFTQILDDAGQVDSSREWPDILYAGDIGVRWDVRSTSTMSEPTGIPSSLSATAPRPMLR